MTTQRLSLRELWSDFQSGTLSRREFVARAAAMGVAGSVLLTLVNAARTQSGLAQDLDSGRPESGTEGQRRGAGGELRVRQWLAPNNLFLHHNTNLERFPLATAQVSSLIIEPLLSLAPDGTLVPTLAAEVPTTANGGLSDDLATVTFNLKPDIFWSDGEPFTAEDVRWTWRWITDGSNASLNSWLWAPIESVQVLAPTKVQVTYTRPTLAWFEPFAGAYNGGIIPAHVWKDRDQAAVNLEFDARPIGTGPYQIETFEPGALIVCSVNPNYREPDKPFFETVRFEGGGDSATDAQAVLQDGEGDVAPLLFLDPEILLPMASDSGAGQLIASVPTEVERIAFNFSDPNTTVDGERSSLLAQHPFLTDKRVRQAMALAIDREAIAEIFLDVDLHPPARNILTGIAELESPNTSFLFDIEAANALLDEAGWRRTGDVRTKDGVEMAVTYFTAAGEDNALVKRFRRRVQAVVKTGWEAIGIRVELGQLNGNDFFFVVPENEASYAHFYRDVEMWSAGPDLPFPHSYFGDWYAGPDNDNVAQRANGWSGWNLQRYVNPEFDRLYEEVVSTIDPLRAADLFIAMNDVIVQDVVVVPLVARPDMLTALSNRIAAENVGASRWEPIFWNIANWRTV